MSGNETCFCTNCGAEVQANANFCPRCGATIPHMPAAEEPAATSPSPREYATAREMLLKERPPQRYQPHDPAASRRKEAAEKLKQQQALAKARKLEQGNSAATVGLVCGIISVICPLVLSGTLFADVIGLILGIVAVSQSQRAKDLGVRGGMQSAALALGVVGLCLCLLILIAVAMAIGQFAGAYGSFVSFLHNLPTYR